jgi:hypothetical protein
MSRSIKFESGVIEVMTGGGLGALTVPVQVSTDFHEATTVSCQVFSETFSPTKLIAQARQ